MALKPRLQPKKELFHKLAGRQFYHHSQPNLIYTISHKINSLGRIIINWDADTSGNGSGYQISAIVENIRTKEWILINK